MTETSGQQNSINDEWEDVEPDEKQILFTNIGDVFIGKFTGWSKTKSGIPQAHFNNDEGAHFTNCGWSLNQQLKQIQIGWTVRMEKTGEQDTGQDTPMALMKVQFKRT